LSKGPWVRPYLRSRGRRKLPCRWRKIDLEARRRAVGPHHVQLKLTRRNYLPLGFGGEGESYFNLRGFLGRCAHGASFLDSHLRRKVAASGHYLQKKCPLNRPRLNQKHGRLPSSILAAQVAVKMMMMAL
jgi:hypothetical protein